MTDSQSIGILLFLRLTARPEVGIKVQSYPRARVQKTKGTLVNKAQLIDAIAVAADLPKTVAGKTLDAVLECISKSLSTGDVVALMGFGTFSVKTRAARVGRNPKTGAEIHIKAARVPNFKAGKALKDAVDEVVEEKAEQA